MQQQQPALPTLGPIRKLDRNEAIEQYVVLRLLAEDIARLEFMLKALKNGQMNPPAGSRFSSADLADTTRTVLIGWVAKLNDRNPKAMYSFDCLYQLFPLRSDIVLLQRLLEAFSAELREFRNNVAFHPCAVLADHIKARRGMRDGDAFLDFVEAMSTFRKLMDSLEQEELDDIPEFPEVLNQLGVSHHPAFARTLSRLPRPTCRVEDSWSVLPDSCNVWP